MFHVSVFVSAVSQYITHQSNRSLPRLPLEGHLDLTYRCNNTCRHCWLWLPEQSPEREKELSFDEIRRIADEARAMGCRQWNISGGEPMLRPDFVEIFDYLTARAVTYGLNTNGTLITPEIARKLKRKGDKMVALYGATAAVYDHVTRHPGGFKMAMRGMAYLKEAGARFTVQLIPMRDNWHEWDAMLALADRLSPVSRVGAPWLYMSAGGSSARNTEIAAQRLAPRDVAALDPIAVTENPKDPQAHGCGASPSPNEGLLAACISVRRDFHIDAYGTMSWCCFAKDAALRYDLRRGNFSEAWNEFIPSLASKVPADDEYRLGCGGCERRSHCHWCPLYAHLEHGRYGARISHLCDVARECEHFTPGGTN